MLDAVAVAASICAIGPAMLFCINLRRYREPLASEGSPLPAVSVLIPARNEESSIAHALDSVLRSAGMEMEVVVMDDASTDRTSRIVSDFAVRDGRVRLVEAPPLPAGWNGKQHACWALASVARYDLLCFVDADVRLEPEALARMTGFLQQSGAALVSGFPRQITITWMEWLLLPLIHFVLLGFLPIRRMRAGTDPAFAAGCGQFLLVSREAYLVSGGHASIRETMHDGLRLPKLLRQNGFRTDLADITQLARCRMYTNAAEVWQGLAKNAIEGLGAPVRIAPVSALLLLGQVVQFVLGAWIWARGGASTTSCFWVALGVATAWIPRFLAARRFRQPLRSAWLHPVGILLLLAVQWYALLRHVLRRPVAWKQRSYVAE